MIIHMMCWIEVVCQCSGGRFQQIPLRMMTASPPSRSLSPTCNGKLEEGSCCRKVVGLSPLSKIHQQRFYCYSLYFL